MNFETPSCRPSVPSVPFVWPLVAYAVGLAALDVIVGVAAYRSPVPRDVTRFLGGLAFGLACGQLALAAAFLVFGRWPLVLRTVVTLAVVAGAAVMSTLAENRMQSWPEDCRIILVIVGTMAAAIFLARLAGVELQNDKDEMRFARRWQFSLSGILSAVTSTALVLALLRYTKSEMVGNALLGTIAAIYATPAWITTACVLGLRNPLVAGIATIFSLVLYVCGLGLVLPNNVSMPGLVWLLAVYATVAVGGLAVARARGYRLAWSWKNPVKKLPLEAADAA